jgi:hypothetical protein
VNEGEFLGQLSGQSLEKPHSIFLSISNGITLLTKVVVVTSIVNATTGRLNVMFTSLNLNSNVIGCDGARLVAPLLYSGLEKRDANN